MLVLLLMLLHGTYSYGQDLLPEDLINSPICLFQDYKMVPVNSAMNICFGGGDLQLLACHHSNGGEFQRFIVAKMEQYKLVSKGSFQKIGNIVGTQTSPVSYYQAIGVKGFYKAKQFTKIQLTSSSKSSGQQKHVVFYLDGNLNNTCVYKLQQIGP
jgi:hypothetical protein